MQEEKKTQPSGRGTAAVYIFLRALVVAIMVRGFFIGEWNTVFYCALTLVLFTLPSLIERRLKIDLPSALEIIVLLFIFAAEILGELGAFYIKIASWDVILHTTNGFLMAAIGIALIDILNRNPKINLSLSPFFVAFVAFCFSMTIGVLWEFSEYGADVYLGTDMQKDTITDSLASVNLQPDDKNEVYYVTDINEVIIKGKVNGEDTEIVVNGYLDIGLHDTMDDMFVNLLGALAFSILGGFYIKNRGRGRGKMAGLFIPRMLSEDEVEGREEERAAKKSRRRDKPKK